MVGRDDHEYVGAPNHRVTELTGVMTVVVGEGENHSEASGEPADMDQSPTSLRTPSHPPSSSPLSER